MKGLIKINEKISLELAFIPEGDMTDIALCVGEEFQNGTTHAPIQDAVHIYREFYRYDKSEFAKWEKERPAPEWWSYA